MKNERKPFYRVRLAYTPSSEMDDVLCHYGIIGQKWGIRRFQNKDGSYTDAGKKRYGSGQDKKAVKQLSYESQYERASYECSRDKKIQKEIRKVLTSSKDDDIKRLRDVGTQYLKSEEALVDFNTKYLDKLSKSGHEWSGDGSELHSHLKRKNPKYKELADKTDGLMYDFIKSSIKAAKKQEFQSIKDFDQYGFYHEQYKDWYEEGDPRAFAIASTIVKDANGKYSSLFPMQFTEPFLNDGTRIKSRFYDD